MHYDELEKGSELYGGDGYKVYETAEPEFAIVAWESDRDCHLSEIMHHLVKRHALSTNFLARLNAREMAVRRIDPIRLTVVAESSAHETRARFIGAQGTEFTKEQAKAVPDAKPTRLDSMEDTAMHLARSMRAHLMPLDVHTVKLLLRFGITRHYDCCLEVINPRACDFGDAAYDDLILYFGEKPPLGAGGHMEEAHHGGTAGLSGS